MQFAWEELRSMKVVYEDESILVLNKPHGISVTGDSKGINLLTLAREAGEKLLPAHRIDKETSGIILFAKTPEAHAILTRQFNKKTIEKKYLAVIKSKNVPEHGTIDLPLSIGRKNTVRVAAKREDIVYHKEKHIWCVPSSAVLQEKKIYPSTTTFTKLSEKNNFTMLSVIPITGRRHQIRVHLAWIGYPIVGDPLFEKNKTEQSRMLLHAWKIAFTAEWLGNKRIELEAKPNESFLELL